MDFWKGCAAPAIWTRAATSLPDLLSLSPSSLRGKPTVFVGGPSLRSSVRLATLLTGLVVEEDVAVPNPGLSTPVIVVEPPKLDLVKLEARTRAGHQTLILTADDPYKWEGALREGAAFVPLTPELSAGTPDGDRVARYLPWIDRALAIEVSSLMHTVHIPAGAHVVEAGLAVGCAAWIRSGQVVLADDRVLGPGSMLCGEVLLASHQAYPHSIVAIEDVELDALSLSAYRALTEAKRASVVGIDRAVATSLARRIGTPQLETPWLHTASPATGVDADWRLYWPLLQRKIFDGVDVGFVGKAFRESHAGFVAMDQVLYEPGLGEPEVFVVLEGLVEIDDGLSVFKAGPGHFGGNLGLHEIVGKKFNERAKAVLPSTVLFLGEGAADRIWELVDPGFRRALLHTLRDRWAARF